MQEVKKMYIKEKEAAEMIGLSVYSLRSQRHKKRGIPFIKVGRSVMYSVADIHEYMNANKIKPETKNEKSK